VRQFRRISQTIGLNDDMKTTSQRV